MRDPLNRKSNRFRFKSKRSNRLDRGISSSYSSPLSTLRGRQTFKSRRAVQPMLSSGRRGPRASSGYRFNRHQQKIFRQRSYGGVAVVAIVAVVLVVAIGLAVHRSHQPDDAGVVENAATVQAAQDLSGAQAAFSSSTTGTMQCAWARLTGTDASLIDAGPTADYDDRRLVIVNAQYPLEDDFEVYTGQVSSTVRVDNEAVSSLQQMISDMQDANLSPKLVSGYRSSDEQTELFNAQVAYYQSQGMSAAEADAEAAKHIERPKQSEHVTGFAVDIATQGTDLSNGLNASLASTPEIQWLLRHSIEYGFILRYPADKTAITGVAYEPWHFRYVGSSIAKDMTAKGLCLEEYVALTQEAAASDEGDDEDEDEYDEYDEY